MSRKRIRLAIQWHTAKRKKPIVESTVAISSMIALLAERVSPVTPNNILKYIESSGLIGLYDEKAIMQAYVDIGQGDEVLVLQYI